MGNWGIRALACVVLVAPGCGPEHENVDVPRERSGNEGPLEPRRGTIAGGTPVDRTIVWPQEIPDEGRRTVVDPRSLAVIDRSPVPVLLPDDVWLDNIHVAVGPHWTALSFAQEGLTLNLQSSARARVYAGIRGAEPSHRVRDLPGHITRNEGIWSASWIENGVAHSLELECDELRRPECADERALLSIADQLVFAGGSEAR